MTDTLARLGSALAGRYAIERELGAGGMATVYLAQDVRHDRRVALKVLRPELAAVIGAERFLAEIKTTANLQHPHILALFDSGEADGFLFYVMPYVEGESLRDRLNHEKQLPVADAVRIASEVASALDYAHRHHVIHRDIKPENILLHDGQALVADFGIALAVSTAGNTRMTETGMSLGTPFYMSPEQAMGEREITARSDVYALGAVLYEMLTGEPPFTGPTAQAIIAKVVTEEPRPLMPKRHTIPPHLEAAVLTALEKLAADRFASAADFAAALKDPGYRTAAATVAIPAAGKPADRRRMGVLVVASALVAGLGLGAVLVALLRHSPRPPVIRYGLALPASQAPDPAWGAVPSPDGSRIAYVGSADGQLWIKQRDRYEARPLPGSRGAVNFTWSPDGQWIAFTAGLEVRKIPVVGGAAVTIADSASSNMGLAWLDDGTIVYIRRGGTGFRRVPASGGASTEIYSADGNVDKVTPLPDGRGVLFIRCTGSCVTSQELWALDLRDGAAHPVMPGVALGQYLPTGNLMTIRGDGAMFVVPFDLKRLVTTGSPIPIIDSVSVVNGVLPLVAVSAAGTLVMRQGTALSLLQRYQMVWIDRTGRETVIDSSWQFRFTNYGANYGWSLSPDGKQLAIGLFTDAGDDIWVKQLPRGPLSRVSYDSASEYRPRWMPDGRSVMFGSNRQGGEGIGGLYARRADGTGSDSLLFRAPAGIFEADWSPDGQWLLFRTGGTIGLAGGRDIVGLRPGVDSAPVPVVATPYDEEAIAISPNGHWLAYESNETGRTEVFLRPFPNTQTGKRQVSNGGGVAPLWSRDGRELFYINSSRDMMAVTVAGTGDPELGERRRLFHLDDRIYMTSAEFYTPYDIAPDGRFIMARNVTEISDIEVPLIVVENWFEEVRQKVGGR